MRAGMPGSGVPSDLMDLVQLTTAFMCSSSYLSAVRAPLVIARICGRVACSSAQACWGPLMRAQRRAGPDVHKHDFLTITGMDKDGEQTGGLGNAGLHRTPFEGKKAQTDFVYITYCGPWVHTG